MPYTVVIDTKAGREIRALPRQEQNRIVAKIEALAVNPRPAGCVKLSGDSGLWRIRSGVYRIIYQIEDARVLITIIKVGHRRDIYRGV
jgi:mRNA interferase RelE/StbE